MKRVFYLLVLLCLIALLSACGGGSSQNADAVQQGEVAGEKVKVAGGAYTDVDVAELQSMLANKDFTFVNVHIPFEGDIANTDVSIPYDQIEQNLSLLPPEKDAKIVLYCRSDRMSNIAAETLVSLGYSNVYNLKGGMVAWERAGLPLVK